jgi:hypothetical protein
MEIGLQVWRLRKAGHNFYEIHKQLELPLSVIHEACRQFEVRVSMDTARALEHYRSLDDARIESLLKCWLPIAIGGPIEVQKVRDGQTYTELDCDLPLKASYLVLQAVERRVKLMAANQPGAGKDGQGETNVLVWLQQVLPNINKVVQQGKDGSAGGGEPLILESEAENWE